MLCRKRREVMNVSADEYPVPPPVVGRGAVFVEHRLKSPQVSESANIAPTAVLAGDVTVGPHSRVLFGAVITAEGDPVQIGSNCVVMENTVIRGVPGQETRVGDDAVIGPHAHLTGCVIEGGSRIATGAVVFNGARIEAGAEVEFNAVVYVNTVVPSGVAVPMGLVRRRAARRTGSTGRLGPHPRHGAAGLPGHGLRRGRQRHRNADVRRCPPLCPGTGPASPGSYCPR
jgi:carbonic anhydrase/acetyltransferase-like protein (isoleucine patch superfamily)